MDEPKELDVSNITDDKLRFEIIHETIEYAFIDRINTIKCNISIYIPYNNEPLRFELHTKANKVFSLIDGYSKGEEIKCYERRFITPRNVEKVRSIIKDIVRNTRKKMPEDKGSIEPERKH